MYIFFQFSNRNFKNGQEKYVHFSKMEMRIEKKRKKTV